METQRNPNEPGKSGGPGQQGGQEGDRERQERERQQREREKQGAENNPEVANKAAVSKADDKPDCPCSGERREATPAACYARVPVEGVSFCLRASAITWNAIGALRLTS